MLHVFGRFSDEFALLRLALFVFSFDDLLGFLRDTQTFLLHARFNALFHLEARHQAHLQHLRALIKLLVQLLYSLLG